MPRKLIVSGLMLFAALSLALALQGRREPRRWNGPRAFAKVGEPGEETKEAANAALPAAGIAWKEVTTRPYDSDDPRYRDPVFSNSSGGAGLVAGRMTGLAVGSGYIYAGGADGGVFRSGDNGVTWTPLTDGLPTL